MKKSLLLLMGIMACGVSSAQSWPDTLALIEKNFSRYKPDNPGCQLAISRNGQILFSGAWGMADLEHHAALSTTSVIEAGSVSKQFTAACILLLEQQGKLSLNDNVRKYIPELPDYGSPILLRNMVHHTSGLKDWANIAGLTGLPEGSREYDNDDVLDILSRQKTINNKPGDEFIYSNSNYILLAIVINRVSGMDLAAFSDKYIFGPAGMKHTRWRNHFRDIVPDRAIAYGYNGSFYFTQMPNENVYGNAGLITTAEDLLAWNNYYLSGRFGSPALLASQLAVDNMNNGGKNGYAAGLMVGTERGWKTISHNGSTAAYRCDLCYFPDFGLSFAWMSNTDQFDRDIAGIINNVHGIFIRDKPAALPKKEISEISVSAQKLSSYAGWYNNSQSDMSLHLLVKEGKLGSPGTRPLIPIAENVFLQADGGKMIFRPSGRKGLLSIYPGGDSTYFAAVDSARLTPDLLKDYAGNYHSDEAQASFSISIQSGKPVLHENAHDEEIMEASCKDGFTYWRGNIHFERNPQGNVVRMKISLPRARNIVFEKR